MHDILIATIGAVSGGGFSQLISMIGKRRLNRKQEKKTDVETDGIAVTSLKEAIVTLNEEVYKPIQNENKKLKDELKKFTNELTKFRKAIEKISICDHADSCPVNRELQSKTTSDSSSDKN